MSSLVRVPLVSTNEDTVTLVAWRKAPGDQVQRGEVLCSVETTKANVEVEAEHSGYLRHLAEPGQRVRIGDPLGALVDRPDEDHSSLVAATAPQAAQPEERRWTKKAALVAARLGVDLESLAVELAGATITEADVRAAQARGQRGADLVDDQFPAGRPERILLLGGAAGGGSIVIDALSRTPGQRAVGVLDNNPATHGHNVMGVPVLGPISRAEEIWQSGICDGVVIAFVGGPLEDRVALFERLTAAGLRFSNVIDPSAGVRSHVVLGCGNLVMANSYLAACVTLGNNNFLASHTCIEHHSRVGSHCLFGPRVTITGAVTIGDRVKFGAAVAVEPYLTIGDDALIASGCILTADVPSNTVVKARVSHVAQARTRG